MNIHFGLGVIYIHVFYILKTVFVQRQLSTSHMETRYRNKIIIIIIKSLIRSQV